MYTKEIDADYHSRIEMRRELENPAPIIKTSDPVVLKLAQEIADKAAEHGFVVAYVGSADAAEPPQEIEDEEMEV